MFASLSVFFLIEGLILGVFSNYKGPCIKRLQSAVLKPLVANYEPESVHIGKLAAESFTVQSYFFLLFGEKSGYGESLAVRLGSWEGEVTHCF